MDIPVDTPGPPNHTGRMEPLTLTELGRRMAARRATLIALSVIGLIAGVLWHLVSPSRYEATTVVRVDAADPALVDMAAEEALARSRQVTAEALDALDVPGTAGSSLTIESLEAAVSARAVPRSRVLEVSCTASSGQAAARGADAVAQAYLAVRDAELGEAGRSPGAAPSSADVVDPARTPSAPIGPGLLPSGVAGLMIGLLAAAPLAARPPRRSQPRLSRAAEDCAS